MARGSQYLQHEPILNFLRPGGVLSTTIKGYEARDAQVSMTLDVIEAYNHNEIALIEAGTGTGKSIAYLIPALLWAAKNNERTLISTHTITLQEQLLYKDIPFLLKILNLDLKVVLAKGMSNYLCLRKLNDALHERSLFSSPEQEELEKVDQWQASSKCGSRADLPFVTSVALWEQVSAESDACSHTACPYYKECHFFKARKESADAHILIVNHHLLCADLVRKKESDNGNGGILPPYNRLIIDEAHHIEDVATEYFADKVTKLDILKQLSLLSSERKANEKTSKLALLKQKLFGAFGDSKKDAIIQRIDIDLAATRQTIHHLIHEFFQAILFFFEQFGNKAQVLDSMEMKWRLLKEHFLHPFWKEEVKDRARQLLEELKKYIASISGLEDEILALSSSFDEKTKSIRIDIQASLLRLKKMSLDIEEFTTEKSSNNFVKWVEMRSSQIGMQMTLATANLQIANLLQEMLFLAVPTVILCSATLATHRSFDFIKKNLGLIGLNKTIKEKIYDSPFNYEKQALLVVPKDTPKPSDSEFIIKASDLIWNAIVASSGQAFVLFTSFQMLKACYVQLKDRLAQGRFPLFMQGDFPKKTLLKAFKETKYAVLFGTDSFWEGVDIVGDALKCVIIVKLPFKVPSEPITQARCELIVEEGGDPFMDYFLPNAIVKFKQGFGRLIRNQQDRGCVVCLDARILNKNYGKLFLKSLPKCATYFEDGLNMNDVMKKFYIQKH